MHSPRSNPFNPYEIPISTKMPQQSSKKAQQTPQDNYDSYYLASQTPKTKK